MTTASRYTVSLIVDPAFSEAQLAELAVRMPVWIVDTPENRAATRRIRSVDPSANTVERGVTTFRAELSASPAEWCAGILGAVDEHHGEYSHNPSYGALEAYGTRPTDALCAALAEYGLRDIELLAGDAFRATSRPAR